MTLSRPTGQSILLRIGRWKLQIPIARKPQKSLPKRTRQIFFNCNKKNYTGVPIIEDLSAEIILSL